MASAERAPGREHIPNYPKGFIILRILQLVLSLIILGLCAYSVTYLAYVSNSLMVFTSLVTVIITGWLVSAHSFAPRAYNYWAILALDIFLLVIWLISFALLAVLAALETSNFSYCSYYDYTCYTYGTSSTFSAIVAAGAGLGAINFLLFLISLLIHSIVVCRHRRAGLHSVKVKGQEANVGIQMAPQNPQNPQAFVPVPPPAQQQGVASEFKHDNNNNNMPISQQTYTQPVQQQQQTYPPHPTSSPAPMYHQQGYYPAPPTSDSPVQHQAAQPIVAQPTGTTTISYPVSSVSPDTPNAAHNSNPPSQYFPPQSTGNQGVVGDGSGNYVLAQQHQQQQQHNYNHGQVPPNTYEAPVQHPQTVFEAPSEVPMDHPSRQGR